MVDIVKATIDDVNTIVGIGRSSFIDTYQKSAPTATISQYVDEKFSAEMILTELKNTNFHYNILYHDHQAIGYSKIIFDFSHPKIPEAKITKLERLYVLKEYHDLKLGRQLFDFNGQLAIQNNQMGMWLYVWKENLRAINFYHKQGFKIIGSYDFKISITHSNPNHIMYLEF